MELSSITIISARKAVKKSWRKTCIRAHLNLPEYAACVTFQKAKEEGMQVAIHWQDADSSSAMGLCKVFPDAHVMICGGHDGCAHKKFLNRATN